jgi:hypothetical protein
MKIGKKAKNGELHYFIGCNDAKSSATPSALRAKQRQHSFGNTQTQNKRHQNKLRCPTQNELSPLQDNLDYPSGRCP